MGTASYIVRGLGNPDSFMSCSHGAGRRMSRIAASTTLTVEECDRAMDGIVCERWHKYKGFGKAKGRLDLSEAPQAYKDIEDVIASERDLGDENPGTFVGTIKSLDGFLDCYDGSKLKGKVLAPGIYEKGAIMDTKYLAQAYKLGLKVK